MPQEVALGLPQGIQELPEIVGELIERKGLGTTRMGKITVPAEIRRQPSNVCVELGQAVDEIVTMARQPVKQYKGAPGTGYIGIRKRDRAYVEPATGDPRVVLKRCQKQSATVIWLQSVGTLHREKSLPQETSR